MKYKEIDMKNYVRKEQFDYFSSMAFPYVGLTANIDLTKWLAAIRERKAPFFLSFLYAATKAANAIPEFRQRILQGSIIEYDKCIPSYTVALNNHSYCYCAVDCDMPFEDFIPYAAKEQERAKQRAVLDDEGDVLSLFFVTTVTNVAYTAIIQPVPQPADSNPRITWGQQFEQDGKILMPVTLLCNHALMDGYHLGLFYEKLKQELERFL